MKRKRTDRMRIILVAGNCGIMTGRNVTEGLMTLQILQNLKNNGFQITGSSVCICRISCSRELGAKIRQRSKNVKDTLVLEEREGVQKEIRQRFRRKVQIQMKELIVAACSEALFYIIDQKPDTLQMLSLEEALLRFPKTLPGSE